MGGVALKLSICLGALAVILTGCMSQEERAALLNGPYPLQVDYSRSIEESLLAGRYDWVYYRLNSAVFPGGENGTGKISAVLVPFSPQASLEYVFGLQAAAGLRPATIRELLAFGETYPEVQRKLPVIALGSSADLIVTITVHDSPADPMMRTFTRTLEKVERVYPFLSAGLPGRSAGAEWLDDPDGYSMYYACFVKARP
jgi:hypothetical protein